MRDLREQLGWAIMTVVWYKRLSSTCLLEQTCLAASLRLKCTTQASQHMHLHCLVLHVVTVIVP